VAKGKGEARAISAAEAEALGVLQRCGRSRRSSVTEIIEALDNGDSLSRPIGFVHNVVAQRLIDRGRAELELSAEFVTITVAGCVAARICPVCLGDLGPDDEGPECDPTGCPGREYAEARR
jgi:hypothetical protein